MNADSGGNGEMLVYVIACECGFVIKGDIEVELLSNARNHIDEAHPKPPARSATRSCWTTPSAYRLPSRRLSWSSCL